MQSRWIRIIRAMRLRQWLVLLALFLVLVFTAYYTVRVVRFIAFDRQAREMPIRGWMRVGYVARTHHVPVAVLNDAIGLPHDADDRRPLRRIAESQGRSFEEISIELTQAIAEYRASHPPATGGQD